MALARGFAAMTRPRDDEEMLMLTSCRSPLSERFRLRMRNALVSRLLRLETNGASRERDIAGAAACAACGARE